MIDWVSSSGPQFCDGVNRRRMLQVGGLGTMGLGLPDLLAAQARAAEAVGTFGRAKRMILLFFSSRPRFFFFDDPIFLFG